MHCSVKFRLDESGDIIWYNDVVWDNFQELSSPAATESPNESNPGGGGDVFNELASILLACESFDILTSGTGGEAGLSFSTYAGQTIDFKVLLH